MIDREYFEGWVKGTRASYGDDPTEYNGADIDYCKNCGEEPKEHGDVCADCIEYFDEMEQTSLCCGDTLHVDTNRCQACYEWSESLFDEHCEEHNFNRETYKYEPKNKENEKK